MKALTLAAILTVSPLSAAAAPSAWPAYIEVFRRHARGSSIPARVDRVRFDVYVGRTMASGAWPAYKPMDSLRAGAVIIAARARWLVKHPDRRMRWRGRQFSVTDGSKPAWCPTCDHGMLYRNVKVHSRIKRAVADVLGVNLRKRGRMAKPQWSGNGRWCGDGYRGNRLPEGGATACARQGWGWRRIVRRYINDVTIVEPSR